MDRKHLEQALNPISKTLAAGVTAARIQQHVIAPAHTRDIRIESVARPGFIKTRAASLKKKGVRAAPLTLKTLNLQKFSDRLHAALKDDVIGYKMQLRQNGSPIWHLVWDWGRRPFDGGEPWTDDTRMHIASLSKFPTAVAMLRALDRHGVSPDAAIADYLPAYWHRGPRIGRITFRHLLTHTSGFDSGGKSNGDFAFMKSMVAAGVAKLGSWHYENMNFSLCRILLTVLDGALARGFQAPLPGLGDLITDLIWDVVCLDHYRGYVHAHVFAQAGIADTPMAPTPGRRNALAYVRRGDGGRGWDSGDLLTMAGTAGFHLSTNEVLDVMDRFRRRATILSRRRARWLLDNGFGIDRIDHTGAGTCYYKSGYWTSGDDKTEQAVLGFLGENMEIAVLVNSRIGAADRNLMGTIADAYKASLRPRLLVVRPGPARAVAKKAAVRTDAKAAKRITAKVAVRTTRRAGAKRKAG